MQLFSSVKISDQIPYTENVLKLGPKLLLTREINQHSKLNMFQLKYPSSDVTKAIFHIIQDFQVLIRFEDL